MSVPRTVHQEDWLADRTADGAQPPEGSGDRRLVLPTRERVAFPVIRTHYDLSVLRGVVTSNVPLLGSVSGRDSWNSYGGGDRKRRAASSSLSEVGELGFLVWKGRGTGTMVVDKGKKSKVEEATSDHSDGELVLSIERLQEIQDEIEKVNEEASDKVLEVEQKYNEIRRPIYGKRNEIVRSIPDFWLTAFLSHPVIADLLTEEDQKILKYLVSLDVEDFKDVKSGYSITFNFSPNPYFEDTSLTKTYSFFDEGTTKITGTTIKWKEGMNIANGVAHKKGGKRPLSEERFVRVFLY
ncbi:hypothetical protein ZIOFF_063509 [Zingiber officinale]|uniref:NAP1-related protein 2 n=1 Tax=Zingiber officinale TaxID=94328 RepID=A0A8J5F6I4_ZINOF|nr:hypothetical protein ZIOFF_063509 [Zingiber officinale]